MRAWVAAAVCGLLGLAGLAGCAGGAFAPSAGTSQNSGGSGAKSPGATLTGKVRGGQQPIVGAHVYLLAANTTGYGGNGIAASASNASVSLLTSGTGTTLDTSAGATNGDYYVTTDATGSWTITGDYTCTAGQQVYLYALGGDPGAGANAAAGLLAALGTCPSGGNFLSGSNPISYVVINEVSTIATAYAFAGFATDATHVSSSGTALAQTGIANAFANVTNLETLSTGAALAATPAGNGTVPQSEINTLANILASCVNSNGASSTSCTTLYANATADGTSTGTQPSDTATAAINIAHYPTSNIAVLSSLVVGTPPFEPYLAVPNNWIVALNFGSGGINGPSAVAIDSTGNAWVTSFYTNCVLEFSSLGSIMSGPSGFTGGGIASPAAIALDEDGSAWVVNSGNSSITKISKSGVLLSGANGFSGGGFSGAGTVFQPNDIAIDGYGNAWVVNSTGNGVIEFSSAGSPLSGATGYTGIGLDFPTSLAIDASENIWITTHNNIIKMSSVGIILPGYTGSALNSPSGVAFDAAGNAWVANHLGSNIVELSSSGTVLSGANGYTPTGILQPVSIVVDGSGNTFSSTWGSAGVVEISNSGVTTRMTYSFYGAATDANLYFPDGIAVDGSGNMWVASNVANVVVEVIGAATPVVTPLSVGVRDNKLGTRP